mgnify:CR=1 FL=1
MDEAVGTVVQQVGQLTQLGVAGLCLAALLYTYLRTIPRLQGQLARRGREVRALYQAMLPAEQRAAVREAEAALEAAGHNGEGAR